MEVPFSGGCACGAIRYEVHGRAALYGQLPLPGLPAGDRQRLFSGRGGEGERIHPAQRRAGLVRKARGQGPPHAPGLLPFECGSPVFLVNGANASARALYAGSLDDPSGYRPSRDIFVGSAQPWNPMHPDLPKDKGMPGG